MVFTPFFYIMETDKLIQYLSQFTTERRVELFKGIVQKRSRYLSVVLEDIFQPHNASAVLRTCDCFGVQDVHIIENENCYNVNPDVALGSDKWLKLYKYNQDTNNTLEAYRILREKGYRIVATTPHKDDVNLHDFDLDRGKAAFVFGTELKGLSQIAIDNADEYVKIPMYGFTESFNISVSAAIILHHLTNRLYNSEIDWSLNIEEKEELILDWLRKTIKSSESLEKQFTKQNRTM